MTDRNYRDEAIKNVDSRCGYTYEFSSSPEAHLAEYDEEEARLREVSIVPGDGQGPDVDPDTGDEAETFQPDEDETMEVLGGNA